MAQLNFLPKPVALFVLGFLSAFFMFALDDSSFSTTRRETFSATAASTAATQHEKDEADFVSPTLSSAAENALAANSRSLVTLTADSITPHYSACVIVTTRLGQGIVDEAIAESRMLLFEHVTWPSVRNQSFKNFSWYVTTDTNFPGRHRLQALASTDDRVTIIFRDRPQSPPSRCSGSTYRIVTRIDSDDAMHKSVLLEAFLWTLKWRLPGSKSSSKLGPPVAVLSVTSGLTWSPDRGKSFWGHSFLPSCTIGLTVITHNETGKLPRAPVHVSYWGWLHKHFAKDCSRFQCYTPFSADYGFVYTRSSSSRSWNTRAVARKAAVAVPEAALVDLGLSSSGMGWLANELTKLEARVRSARSKTKFDWKMITSKNSSAPGRKENE